MTPFEITLLLLFSLIFLNDLGREYMFQLRAWWVILMIAVSSGLCVALLITLKGFFQ
jgi:hypothetical protein